MSSVFDPNLTSPGLRAWQLAEQTRASGRWASQLANRPSPGLINLDANPAGRFGQRWLALPPGRMPLIQRLQRVDQPGLDPAGWLRRAATLDSSRGRQTSTRLAQPEPAVMRAGPPPGYAALPAIQRRSAHAAPGLPSMPHGAEPAHALPLSRALAAPLVPAPLAATSLAVPMAPPTGPVAPTVVQRQPLRLSQARGPASPGVAPGQFAAQPFVPPALVRPLTSPHEVTASAFTAQASNPPEQGQSPAMISRALSGRGQRQVGPSASTLTAQSSITPHQVSADPFVTPTRRVQRQIPGLVDNLTFASPSHRLAPSAPDAPSRQMPTLLPHLSQAEQVAHSAVQVPPGHSFARQVQASHPSGVGPQPTLVQPQRLEPGGSANPALRLSQPLLASPPNLAQAVLQRWAQPAPSQSQPATSLNPGAAQAGLIRRTPEPSGANLGGAALLQRARLLNPGRLALLTAPTSGVGQPLRLARAALYHPGSFDGSDWHGPTATLATPNPPSLARPVFRQASGNAHGFAERVDWPDPVLPPPSPTGSRQPLAQALIKRAHAMPLSSPPNGIAPQPTAGAPQPVQRSFQPDLGRTDPEPAGLPFARVATFPAPDGASQGPTYQSPGLLQRRLTPSPAPSVALAAQLVQRLDAPLGPALPATQPYADHAPLALSTQRPLAASQVFGAPVSQGRAVDPSAEPPALPGLTRAGEPPIQRFLSRQRTVADPSASTPALAAQTRLHAPDPAPTALLAPAPTSARAPELLRPITPVQRAPVELAASAPLTSQAQLSLSSPEVASASAAAPEPDLDALAQKVYERLQRRLRIDQERLGRY